MVYIHILYFYYKFIKYPKLLKWRWLIPWEYDTENLNLNNHIILYDYKICFIGYNFLNLDENFQNLKLINFITYPIRISSYKTELFYKGKFHRDDGPSIITLTGNKFWCIDGNYHREDGPAIEYGDGRKCWYLNGNSVHEKDIVLKNFKLNLKFEN